MKLPPSPYEPLPKYCTCNGSGYTLCSICFKKLVNKVKK